MRNTSYVTTETTSDRGAVTEHRYRLTAEEIDSIPQDSFGTEIVTGVKTAGTFRLSSLLSHDGVVALNSAVRK